MAQFEDINTEPDAYLALSWISDICDLETFNLIAKFGAIETLNVINQSSPRNAVEKRRKNRLSNLGEIQELKSRGSGGLVFVRMEKLILEIRK